MFDSLNAHATGLPLLDAQADFRRARRAHAVARISRWLKRERRGSCPLTVADPAALLGGVPRMKVVQLRSIVGTLEPTPHFDDHFRPASEHVRGRWERIALAHRKGDALPPIVVRERPEGYYVLDGRHRVSVARALGHEDIDAWVTGGVRRGRAKRD
jgi:ParB-like nuclease domain